jgi:hypothetical protein
MLRQQIPVNLAAGGWNEANSIFRSSELGNTAIASNGYLVVARNVALVAIQLSGRGRSSGPFTNQLSRKQRFMSLIS